MIPRTREFYLFDIFGFKVTADWSWLAIFFLMSWSLATGFFPTAFAEQSSGTCWLMGSLASAFLFLSVLAHEVGHSYMAHQNGIRIRGIRLFIFGGIAQLEREPDSPEVELKVALAGPAVSAILAAIFHLLSQAPVTIFGAPFILVTSFLTRANLVIALFNLIPGFPLDGGRVFRAVVWKTTQSYFHATRIASNVGRLVAIGLITFGALSALMGGFINGLWLILIGIFLHKAARQTYAQIAWRPSWPPEPRRTLDFEFDEMAKRVNALMHEFHLRTRFLDDEDEELFWILVNPNRRIRRTDIPF